MSKYNNINSHKILCERYFILYNITVKILNIWCSWVLYLPIKEALL